MRPAILLALCAATGCGGPDVTLLTWDTIDPEDAEAKLAAPTATVDDLDSAIADIGDELAEWLKTLGDAGFNLYDAIDDPNETVPTVYDAPEDDGEGTQFYVRIACPGPNGDGPDPDFAFGSIRLDSPIIDVAEAGESMSIAGPIFLTFDDCRAGDALLVGGIPGHYDDVANVLALDGELTVERAEDDKVVRDGPVIVYQDAKQIALSWLVVPDRYAVARVVNGSDFTSFGVELADGSATCTWGDGLSCDITAD